MISISKFSRQILASFLLFSKPSQGNRSSSKERVKEKRIMQHYRAHVITKQCQDLSYWYCRHFTKWQQQVFCSCLGGDGMGDLVVFFLGVWLSCWSSNGISKGFAVKWDAHKNTQVSAQKLQALTLSETTSHTLHWQNHDLFMSLSKTEDCKMPWFIFMVEAYTEAA